MKTEVRVMDLIIIGFIIGASWHSMFQRLDIIKEVWELQSSVSESHTETLAQIEKQITAHTKYIKALRDCLEEK